jgi:hypothetical protein
VNLSGDVIHQNQEDTNAYYGKNVTYDEILSGHVHAPASADQFEHTVAQICPGGQANQAGLHQVRSHGSTREHRRLRTACVLFVFLPAVSSWWGREHMIG